MSAQPSTDCISQNSWPCVVWPESWSPEETCTPFGREVQQQPCFACSQGQCRAPAGPPLALTPTSLSIKLSAHWTSVCSFSCRPATSWNVEAAGDRHRFLLVLAGSSSPLLFPTSCPSFLPNASPADFWFSTRHKSNRFRDRLTSTHNCVRLNPYNKSLIILFLLL